MALKIMVIGPGRIGAQIAFLSLMSEVVSTVYLKGRDNSKTEGIAQDLLEAFPQGRIVVVDGYQPPEPVQLTFFTFSTLKWSSKIKLNDRYIEVALH